MEQRKSERVQYFQIVDGHEIHPVWVFRHDDPDAILGLLLDISDDGVQILTQLNEQMDEGTYSLTIHSEESITHQLCQVDVRRVWVEKEGTLYLRSGFIFIKHSPTAEVLMQSLRYLDIHHKWLRCELIRH